MEVESLLPEVNEPLEEYFLSARYKESASTISFTTMKEQEKSKYIFWRSLTPCQRLELHQMMIDSLYPEELTEDSNLPIVELTFTGFSL